MRLKKNTYLFLKGLCGVPRVPARSIAYGNGCTAPLLAQRQRVASNPAAPPIPAAPGAAMSLYKVMDSSGKIEWQIQKRVGLFLHGS